MSQNEDFCISGLGSEYEYDCNYYGQPLTFEEFYKSRKKSEKQCFDKDCIRLLCRIVCTIINDFNHMPNISEVFNELNDIITNRLEKVIIEGNFPYSEDYLLGWLSKKEHKRLNVSLKLLFDKLIDPDLAIYNDKFILTERGSQFVAELGLTLQ